MPDKLGMRCPGRQTIRPAPSHNQMDVAFEVGAPVDAWWSDGWWEGVVTGIVDSGDESLQVFVPGENLLLIMSQKNLRVSRDWMGNQWVDIEVNPSILSAISAIINPDAKLSAFLTAVKEPESGDFPVSCQGVPTTTKLDIVEEEKMDSLDLDDSARSDGLSGGLSGDVNAERPPEVEHGDNNNRVSGSLEKENNDGDTDDEDCKNNPVNEEDDTRHRVEELETAGQKCGAELLEVVS